MSFFLKTCIALMVFALLGERCAHAFKVIVDSETSVLPPSAASSTEAPTTAPSPKDPSRRLLAQFQQANPTYREHTFAQVTDVYEDNSGNPGVRLERILVAPAATLVEITGLPRTGNPYSAIINKQTVRLVQEQRSADLLRAEGAIEIQDSRGGSALLLEPGRTLYLWFGPIDDMDPFSLEHRLPDGEGFAYFMNLDPRFIDRYRRDFELATTPESRYQFLVKYAGRDPDGRAGTVFNQLMEDLRGLHSFEGYYRAYLIARNQADALLAKSLANTPDELAKLEHVAIVALADKSRMFDFALQLADNSIENVSESDVLYAQDRYRATKLLTGELSLWQKEDSPIRIRQGRYRVTLAGKVKLPRWQKRESKLLGNYDGADDQSYPIEATVEIDSESSRASNSVNFGNLMIAEFVREAQDGGLHSTWATGDPTVSLKVRDVELIP